MKKTSIFGKWVLGLFTGLCFLAGGNLTAQNTYVKVTSEADLTAGDKYLIVYENGKKALSKKSGNTNFREVADVPIAANSITTAISTSEDETLPFEITLGGETDAWTLYDEVSAEYLRLDSDDNNLNSGDSYEWTISFSDGNAVITASTFTSRTIRYNTSNPRFACYKSGQQAVQLYKKQEASPDAPTVSLQPASLNFSTRPNNGVTETITVTGANLTDDVTVSINGENANLFTADASTLTATDIMAEGGKTLTITYTPTEAGSHTATLTLSSDDLQNPVTAELSGMAGDISTYSKVESASELIDGGRYLIVCESYNRAMAGQTNPDYRDYAEVSISQDSITAMTAAASGINLPFEITLKNENGSWQLYDSASQQYLYLNADENHLYSGETAGSWQITFQDGNATITPTGYTARSIQYNNSSPRFACYKGSQQPVQLYKNVEDVQESSTPSLNLWQTALEFPMTKAGDSTLAEFVVTGENITQDISLSISGEHAEFFSIDRTSLSAEDLNTKENTITVTYAPTEGGVHTATVSLSSEDLAMPLTVSLKGVSPMEASNIAALYDYYGNVDEEETFRVAGQIVVTHTDAFNTRIWAQDANMENGASILIFRAKDYGFDSIQAGDVIEGLTGTMSVYNNLLEFLPTEELNVTESGHALHVDTLSIADIKANILNYQSALICVKDVEFLADTTFATGKNYNLIHGSDTLVFRTDYFGADYIGQNIPSEELTITGILTQFHDDAQITARSLADFALPADYLAAPVFSPAAGTYTDSMEVSISCATEDAEIFYAIDDAEFTAYENAFWIKNSCNIHAFATLNGENSDTTTVAYTIRDTWTPAGDTLLYEPFDAFTTGDWNNDNVAEGSSDIAEDLDDYTLMPGWTGAKVYSVAGTAKMGTSSALGYIALPALTLDQDKEMFAVSFRAMAWDGDATTLRLVVNGDTILVEGLDNNGNNPDNFKSYSFLFENDTEEADICFIGAKTSKGRFFLDDVRVCYMAAEPTLMVDETIEMEAIAGQSTSTTVNVRGLYLAEDVTIICPQGHFSIDPTLLNADSVMRSNGANFTVAYDGTDILDSVSLTLTSGELSQTVMVYARAVEMTQVANLAGLYDYYENLDEEETFRVTGEIVVTHTDAFNTRIWAQDADMTDGASILIFRAGDYGFADIETGDVIEGLTGTMSVYNNLLEFLPTEELNVTESGHALHVDTLSFTEIKANLLDYQSALVCVENVSFTTPDSAFATGTNYDLLQDQDSLVFRTDFYNADYIGEDIPTGQLNITGILTQYYDDAQLTARNMDDIQIIRVANEAYANSMEARIYPNPTSGMFYMDIEGDAQVDIFAANGTLVESLELTAGLHEMNLAHKGIYFVRISNGKALTVKRVIVL